MARKYGDPSATGNVSLMTDVIDKQRSLQPLADVDPARLPRHVAIIMDGNGRWAKQRGKARIEGHRAGSESVRAIVRACGELGIEYLTLYAFSVENWKRPRANRSQRNFATCDHRFYWRSNLRMVCNSWWPSEGLLHSFFR